MASIKVEGSGAAAAAASALRAEQARMKVIAENIANSSSVSRTAGGDPYRRQLPVFKPVDLGGVTGVAMVSIQADAAPFPKEYDPGNPAADAKGYVKLPNVNGLAEALDLKQAQRAYEANLNMLENLDAMEKRTLDIIKK